MIKFDYFQYLLGNANLEYKINLLYNGKNKCLLLGKFISCYTVDKIKDVNKYLYNLDINYVLDKQFETPYKYYNRVEKNNNLKYVLLNLSIPAIELINLELVFVLNVIHINKKSIQSKYNIYPQIMLKYNSNEITNNEVNFVLTDDIHTTYLLDIKKFENFSIYPAYLFRNNKHYIVLLPNPVLFNIFKSNTSLTTSDKYFKEIYSLEELNLCLENYTKQINDKFDVSNIVSL